MAHRKARRKAHPVTRKGRASASRLRSVWKKRTRRGSKYAHLGAIVRVNKRGAVRHGRRKHVKGHSWTGRKGSVALYTRSTGKLWGTNPQHSRRGGFMRRFNPAGLMADAKTMIVSPVVALPRSVPALLKGSVVKNAAFATGGAVVAMVGGNMLQKFAAPLIAKIPGVTGVMGGGMAQRVVGASFALLSGGIVAKAGLKDAASRNAFVTGAAAAALIEAVFPGKMAGLLGKLPVVGPMITPVASPVQGLMGLFGTNDLAAYVSSPAYQGVGAYVQSPAYQGVGAYVQSPAYQGVGGANDAVAGMGYAGNDQLAGNLDGIGSNMMSHLDA